MRELQRLREAVVAQSAKFEDEYDLLLGQLEGMEQNDHAPHPAVVSLSTQQAKRVRRESTLLVQALAQLRDHLQP